MLDRALSIAADPHAEDDTDRLRAFRRFLLMYGAARSWLWLHFLEGRTALSDPLWIASCAALLSVCAAASFSPRTERHATYVAFPVLLIEFIAIFPFADNHFFLELLCIALLCLASRSAEDTTVVTGLRWLCVIVLFHTGLQKVFYGHYFHGDYLAFMVGTDDRFAALIGPVLGRDAVTMLQAVDSFRTNAGPYRVDSAILKIASNGVYLAELGLAPLLLYRRTRRFAAIAAITLIVSIQSAAREIGFALLFGNLLLLFLRENWNRRLLPVFASALALALLLAVLGSPWLLPGSL